MRLLNLGLVVGVAALASLTAPAFADLTYNGTSDGGSWFVSYTIDLTAFTGLSFDRFVVRIANGTSMTFTVGTDVTKGTSGDDATASVFTNTTRFDATGSSFASTFSPSSGWAEGSWSGSPAESSTVATAIKSGSTALVAFVLHVGTDSPNQTAADGTRFFVDVYSGPSNQVAAGQAWVKLNSSGTQVEHFEQLSIVPLPAAFWSGLLMMGALGGIAVLKRRQRVLA